MSACSQKRLRSGCGSRTREEIMTYSIIGVLATILLLIGNRDVLRKQRESEYSRTRLYYR